MQGRPLADPTKVQDPAIASRYLVGDFLGAGGFAEVYRAKQLSTGQDVALKLLRLDHGMAAAPLEVQLERLRREARLGGALHHPNIVPLIDSGETTRGEPFVVFALIPGQDLGNLLAAEGALEPALALRFMTQVMDALSCAHAHGVVHRDLKPENIMISAAGARRNALVLDFGISTVSSEGAMPGLRRVTERGEYLGTPQYSAPEQLCGEPPTLRSDLYAWGLVFIECLIGEPAIGAASPHEAAHRQLDPAPVELPAALLDHPGGHALHELLRTVTQKNPGKRELDAAHVLAALERIDAASLPPREALVASARRGVRAASLGSMDTRAAPRATSWVVAATRNPNFTGREALLQRIAELLDAEGAAPVVALHGLGGVGKSQLALEHAHRAASRHRVIAWLRAEEPETLAADYSALARTLSLRETLNQRRKIEAVRAALEQGEGWLLIFDNAPGPAAIRPYLPRSHAGHILVTSREPSWRGLAASVPVDVLEPEEAIAFLLRRTGEPDRGAARELSEELGRLPLAMEEAAAYVEATGRSLASYLELLRGQRQRVLFDTSLPTGARTTLRTTWELSFRAVERERRRASDLLKLSAYLAPDDVPLSIFRRGAKALPAELREDLEDPLRFDACVATLRRYSLVKVEQESLSVHRLVQLATRERLDELERTRWASYALQMVEAAYPWSAVAGEYHPESGRFLPHASVVLAQVSTEDRDAETAARLLRRTGAYLSARGQQEQACQQLERAQALFGRANVVDSSQLATTSWELGMVLYALGEAGRALEHLQHGLRTLQAQGDAAELLRSQVRLTLAWVQHTLGDFTAARTSSAQALEWLRARLPEEHPLVATALALVGRASWAEGDLEAGQLYADRATLALARSSAPQHPLNCGSYYLLAELRYDRNELEAAAEAAQLGQAIGEHAYGRDHILVCLNLLVRGSVLLAYGHTDDAKRCFERTLEGAQRACHHLHQELAPVRSELARALLAQGDVDAARAQLEHALSELPRICGYKGRAAARAHAALARLMHGRGELDEASQHARHALDALDAHFGSDHPLQLGMRTALAEALRSAAPAPNPA